MGRVAQIRQRELLAATLAVIARKGLSGITVSDIAKEAGWSFGVIAFHFKTKERLLLAALNTLVEEYDEIWSRTAKLRTGSEAAAEMAARIEADFDSRVTSRSKLAVWAAFWGEASRVPAYRKTCGELKRRYRQEVQKLVSLIAKDHGHDVDAEMIAAGLNALVDGFWIYGHVTGDFNAAERARARTACLTFLRSAFPDFFPTSREPLNATARMPSIKRSPASSLPLSAASLSRRKKTAVS
jgi:TetR/AcrR family transcriptional repressor of bet genes